jgi:hypothetical protein
LGRVHADIVIHKREINAPIFWVGEENTAG